MDIFPGSGSIRRKKGRGFEMGRVARWAADKRYPEDVGRERSVKKSSK